MYTLGQLQRKQGHVQTLSASLDTQLRNAAVEVRDALQPTSSELAILALVLGRAGWISGAVKELESLRQDFGAAIAVVEMLAERTGPLGEESVDAMFELQRIEKGLNGIERAIEIQADWC